MPEMLNVAGLTKLTSGGGASIRLRARGYVSMEACLWTIKSHACAHVCVCPSQIPLGLSRLDTNPQSLWPQGSPPLQHSTDTGLWSILRPPCPPPEVRRPPGTQQPPPHRLPVYFYHCSHSPQSQGHIREGNWGKRAWLAPESPSTLHCAQHRAEGHPLPVPCCGWPSNLRLNPVWRKTSFLTLWELSLGKLGEIGLPDFWKRLCPSLLVGERERERGGLFIPLF